MLVLMFHFCFISYFFYQTGEVGSDSLPVYMRIVTRGAVAEIRSDVSSLELFLVWDQQFTFVISFISKGCFIRHFESTSSSVPIILHG